MGQGRTLNNQITLDMLEPGPVLRRNAQGRPMKFGEGITSGRSLRKGGAYRVRLTTGVKQDRNGNDEAQQIELHPTKGWRPREIYRKLKAALRVRGLR